MVDPVAGDVVVAEVAGQFEVSLVRHWAAGVVQAGAS